MQLDENEAYKVFEKIANRPGFKKHGEVWDTEPRGLAMGILQGFYTMPKDVRSWEMFSTAGNNKIHSAIGAYVKRKNITKRNSTW